MTKRDYLKYNQHAADMLGNSIKVGDTVVVNNPYRAYPKVGEISHFTATGRVAIKYTWKNYAGDYNGGYFYRLPNNIVKIKDGDSFTDKDKTEGKS